MCIPNLPNISRINLLSQKSINKVPKGIPLRLTRICDSDEKFDIQSSEYQNYLKARNYNPTLLKKQFQSRGDG